MNTQAIELPNNPLQGRRRARHTGWPMARPARSLLVVLSAGLPAAGIVVLTAWGFSTAAPIVTAAALWAASLVFFALAVDSGNRRALWLAVSGVLLMASAGLSTAVSSEFGILGGLTIAGWAAAAIARRWSTTKGGAARGH